MVIKESRRTPGSADGASQKLNDLVVVVGVVMPQVVAVDQIDFSLLTTADQQVPMGGTADRIGKDHCSSRSQIRIGAAQRSLIERGKVINHVQATASGELHETVAEAVGIRIGVICIESSIAGFKIPVSYTHLR